jgi:cytochrome b6-f complex iron-sulfur subunit
MKLTMRGGPQDRLSRFVDDIVKRRRPRRFKATSQELEALAGAIELAQLQPGADLPDPDFVRRLERNLRRELGLPVKEIEAARDLSRRALLRTAGTVAAAAVLGAVVDRSIVSSGTAVSTPDTVVPAQGRWQPVAALSSLPAGTARPFSTEAIRGVLINDRGTVRALSGVCTHLGCVLKPNVARASLDCPCHRTVFGWDGNVRSSQLPHGPAKLPAIKTRISGNQVEVFVV